jgi:hypothetical protein
MILAGLNVSLGSASAPLSTWHGITLLIEHARWARSFPDGDRVLRFPTAQRGIGTLVSASRSSANSYAVAATSIGLAGAFRGKVSRTVVPSPFLLSR